jgi:hypothetical protein
VCAHSTLIRVVVVVVVVGRFPFFVVGRCKSVSELSSTTPISLQNKEEEVFAFTQSSMSILTLGAMSGVLPRAGVTPRRLATRSAAAAASPAGAASVASPSAPRVGTPGRATRSSVKPLSANHSSLVGKVGGMEMRGGKRGAAVVTAAAAAAAGASTGGGSGPKINLPTWITIVRVIAVPIVTGLFYYPASWAGLALFTHHVILQVKTRFN